MIFQVIQGWMSHFSTFDPQVEFPFFFVLVVVFDIYKSRTIHFSSSHCFFLTFYSSEIGVFLQFLIDHRGVNICYFMISNYKTPLKTLFSNRFNYWVNCWLYSKMLWKLKIKFIMFFSIFHFFFILNWKIWCYLIIKEVLIG